MREFKCPSGAILKVSAAPFADAKRLYQALLKELKTVKFFSKEEMFNFFKDLLCSGFSSELIDEALMPCLQRCTYNHGRGDHKIDKDTFEPAETREDYTSVLMEVTKENVTPFAKSLFAEFSRLVALVEKENPTSK